MKTVKIIVAVSAGVYRVICLVLQKFMPLNTGSMPQSLIEADVIRSKYNRVGRKYFGQQSLSRLHAPRKIEALKLR